MDYITKNLLYNHSTQPDECINPDSLGALWNSNDNDMIKCCVDNTINNNIWERLNKDIKDFDIKLDLIRDKLEEPEFKPPINGYKSQVIARYLCIDGDDGNGARIAFGNKKIILSPHIYGDTAGGDEYGAVALMLRELGYVGTRTRITTNTIYEDVKKQILDTTLTQKGDYGNEFIVNGKLPLWPESSNFGIGKIRVYYLDPSVDARLSKYWRFGPNYVINKSWKDLLTCIPFPYTDYSKCRYTEHSVPITEVSGWRAVSKDEWDRCLDTRKRVDTGSNTYYVPIVSPNSLPYNAREDGIDCPLILGNGLHVTLGDIYYIGDIL